MEITLQDVETAIKVLNEFLRRSREAQQVLRRFEASQGRTGGINPFRMEDFMGEAFRIAKARQEAGQKGPETIEEPPITEEELTNLRAIAKRAKESKS